MKSQLMNKKIQRKKRNFSMVYSFWSLNQSFLKEYNFLKNSQKNFYWFLKNKIYWKTLNSYYFSKYSYCIFCWKKWILLMKTWKYYQKMTQIYFRKLNQQFCQRMIQTNNYQQKILMNWKQWMLHDLQNYFLIYCNIHSEFWRNLWSQHYFSRQLQN